MQEFFILKGSVNPVLEMELIDDGRYSFHKSLFNEALQDSNVTFTMIDTETNIPKISKVFLLHNIPVHLFQYQIKAVLQTALIQPIHKSMLS